MDEKKKTRKPKKGKAPVHIKPETESIEPTIENGGLGEGIQDEPVIEKESRGSTAKKIKDLGAYVGEVALFELSKQIKKGPITTKYVVVARTKPRSGLQNTNVWASDEAGTVSISEPLMKYYSADMTEALYTLGFRLI